MLIFLLSRILLWWHSSYRCCSVPSGNRSLRLFFFVLTGCAMPVLHKISVFHIFFFYRNLCVSVPICTWLVSTCFSFAISTKYIVFMVLLFNITGFLFVYNKIVVSVVSSQDVMHMCMELISWVWDKHWEFTASAHVGLLVSPSLNYGSLRLHPFTPMVFILL